MKTLLAIFLLISVFSCQKDALVSTVPDIEGNWVFTGIKSNEQSPIIKPCREDSKEVTLNITSSSDGYSITGTSNVNTYFSKVTFAMDNTKKAGKIEFEAIGSTKMAGSTNLMTCESNYYNNLKSTSSFRLDGQNLYFYSDITLHDANPNAPILIFERN